MRSVLTHLHKLLTCLIACVSGHSVFAQQDCDRFEHHVVLLQVERTDRDDIPVRNGTGIVVTETGLVLTTWDLLGDLRPVQLIEAQDNEPGKLADFSELAKITGPDTNVPAVIYGYDWHRNLLLLKMEGLDDREPVEIARGRIRPNVWACAIGFDDNRDVPPSIARRVVRNNDKDFTFRLDQHAMDNTSVGGAVIDQASGELIGVLVDGEADFLPVQFVDTLLSQLFISRIMRDLEHIRTVSDELRTGISWGFQIVESDLSDLSGENSKLKLRLYFNKHSSDTDLVQVCIFSKIFGLKKEGFDPSVSDSVEWTDDVTGFQSVPIERGVPHVNYDADAFQYLKLARNQEFHTLKSISISILPQFSGDEMECSPRMAATRSPVKFEIPIGGGLRTDEDSQ